MLCYGDGNKMALNDSIYDYGVDAHGQKSIKSENQSVAFFTQSFGHLGSVRLNP